MTACCLVMHRWKEQRIFNKFLLIMSLPRDSELITLNLSFILDQMWKHRLGEQNIMNVRIADNLKNYLGLPMIVG